MAARSASVKRALDGALRSAQIEPWGEATVAVAKRLAVELDAATDPKAVGYLASQLLASLAALRMTPAARAAVVTGGVPNDSAGGTLANLRDRARANRAATLDGSAS